MSYSSVFSNKKPVIGVIHLLPLPGAPLYDGHLQQVFDQALQEAAIFDKYVDGIIIENFRDAPFYPHKVPVETVAALSAVAKEVIGKVSVPVGINVLRNDACAGMAIAAATGADFIRVNVHIGAVVADQGIIQGIAHEVLRLRKQLYAQNVLIFADVGVKHAAPLVNRGLALETKDLASRGMVDALVVSGTRTGEPTSSKDLALVKQHSQLPVLIGSGTKPENLKDLKAADGFIVGSYFKKGGKAHNLVKPKRVAHFMKVAKTLT